MHISNTSGNQFVLILINYDSHNTCKHLLAVSAVYASAVSAVSTVSTVFVIKVGPRHQSCTLPKHTHDTHAASFTTMFNHGDCRRRSTLCACRRCCEPHKSAMWTPVFENKTEYLFRIMQINTCLVMNVVRNAFTFFRFLNNIFIPAVSAVSAVSASFCSCHVFLQCKPMCITHIDYYSYECLYACSW